MGKTAGQVERGAASGRPRPAEISRKSYNHPCLIARTLDILGDRWTLLILRDLMSGLHRYTDILENCGGMSPNVLSDRLKRLEADGLVQRTREKGLPPRVEYTLTDKGRSVRPILLSLIDWGREHVGGFDETVVETDFAVRVIPTFSFHPDKARGIRARMVIEISDCSECNTWTFEINDGNLHPRRQGREGADLLLRTTADGFFNFIHGRASASECGDLIGSEELASAIQACFQSD
ncbi:MAG: helix-turn-helix transcriptional regulator [Dehalococcoidia bacterium]|nr:helix-turn-helix transcriptional regulator [Dehalococcoidia bacterium]